jgi:hypothetical protein
MSMPVMYIRKMRMAVLHCHVQMRVYMGAFAIPFKIMRVLMVLIMAVRVFVLYWLMLVIVSMGFGQM